MKNVRYILTTNTLNVQLEGVGIFQLSSDDYRFDQAVSLCREQDFDELVKLLERNKPILEFSEGEFEVRGRQLYYRGQPVHPFISERVIGFMDSGLPFRPILRFIERLSLNPSRRATEELFTFLDHKSLPITEDGFFLAYKGVREDYRDAWSGRYLNRVGDTLTMKRSDVDDDARRGCSHGFHAGTLEYAANYMPTDGHLMIVKIDPADVVSIPYDCDCQKLRTWKYTVVDEYEGELPDLFFEDDYVEEDDEEWGWVDES